MPRVRKRTTQFRAYSSESLHQAVSQIINKNLSVRSVAKTSGIPRNTLTRYLIKVKNSSMENVNFRPSNEHSMILKLDEEVMLADYIKHASNIHYGLTNATAWRLAYEFARANQIIIPESWKRDKLAGKEWLQAMMKRHKFSFSCPESVSLSRATSFNEANVSKFFENLKVLKQKQNFEPQDVYNLDETSCLTVHKPPKVIAEKGKKTISQMSSGERGTLVTLVAIIGATGKSVPPFMIFPRVHYKDHMMTNAPPGSKGTASPSGWMVSEIFLPVLEHFAAHERPTKEKPKLLILDNHVSHLSLAAINYARDTGIILLTLPPHCSHKMQPLDVSVFGPMKKFYNQAADTWLVNHPGRGISIYEIAELVGQAFPLAFTPKNICSGFKKTGIEPFDPHIFPPEEFLSSYVTDRPNPANTPEPPEQTLQSTLDDTSISFSLPGPSTTNMKPPKATESNSKIKSPEQIRPHPKAAARKQNTKRQKPISTILTSTPEKLKLATKEKLKEERMQKKEEAHDRKILKAVSQRNIEARLNKSRRTLFTKESVESSESSDSDDDISLHDSDSSMGIELSDEELPKELTTGSFALTKVYGKTKTNFRYYICEIDEVYETGFDVKFYKRAPGTYKFVKTEETGFITLTDLALKLPNPIKYTNGRFAGMIVFGFNFDDYSPLF